MLSSIFILSTIVRVVFTVWIVLLQSLSGHYNTIHLHTNRRFRTPWYLFLTSCQLHPILLCIFTHVSISFYLKLKWLLKLLTFIPILTVSWNLSGLFFHHRIILDLQKSFFSISILFYTGDYSYFLLICLDYFNTC